MCVCETPLPPCINEELQYQVPSVGKTQSGNRVKEVEEGLVIWFGILAASFS